MEVPLEEDPPLEEQQPQAELIPWSVLGFLAGSREGRAAGARWDLPFHVRQECSERPRRQQLPRIKMDQHRTPVSDTTHPPAPEALGFLGNHRNANRQRGPGMREGIEGSGMGLMGQGWG